MKDFRDGNKVIIQQFKGTDKSYDFVVEPDASGSSFIWPNFVVSAEGRLSSASTKLLPDFVFPVTYRVVDGVSIGTIFFPSTLITEQIREDKIYWRVNAHVISVDVPNVRVILYGEIWLGVI
jgi:hypothetical protein